MNWISQSRNRNSLIGSFATKKSLKCSSSNGLSNGWHSLCGCDQIQVDASNDNYRFRHNDAVFLGFLGSLLTLSEGMDDEGK